MPVVSPFYIVNAPEPAHTLERLQRAIYNALTGSADLMAIVTGVYDATPQDEAFPYVTFAADTESQWDTDDSHGFDCVVEIHTWSRYRGQRETKRIQNAVYNALHEVDLTVPFHNVVLCLWESAQQFVDPDGLTRHGVQRFRVIIVQE